MYNYVMKRKLKKLSNSVLNDLFSSKTSVITWLLVFLSMLVLRCFIEQFVATTNPLAPAETLTEFLHNLYFFLLTIILAWLLLSVLLKIKPQKLTYLFVFSTFLMVIPPVIDMIKTGGQVYWSFYIIGSAQDLFWQLVTILGHFPSGIVYFGTRITFVLAIIIVAGLVWLKTKKIIKTLAGAIGTYLVFFFMGAFPTFLAMTYFALTGTRKISDVQPFQIMELIGAPRSILGLTFPSFQYAFAYKLDFFYYPFLILLLFILFYLGSREKFWAAIKNFRYPQVIFHSGLLFIGMGLGYLKYASSFTFDIFSICAVLTMLISAWLAWKTSIIVNDLADLEIDKITNASRPLPKEIFTRDEYVQLGIICFLLSLLGAVTVGAPFFVLMLVYQILAWFYSSYPLRLKRFPGIATATGALTSLLIVFSGYMMMSPDQTIHSLSWQIIALLFLAYTLAMPIKDFKDIAGDKKHGVWTVPVIFGERNGRLIVATAVFIVYMLSVFFLSEPSLFFWALLFGVITFFAIISEKIKPRQLPGVVLGIVAVYGLILVRIMFM